MVFIAAVLFIFNGNFRPRDQAVDLEAALFDGRNDVMQPAPTGQPLAHHPAS